MKDDISHFEDELSRLTKNLEEEGESDEIILGLDNILGQLADHLKLDQPQPNLIGRIGERMTGFFKGILGRIRQRDIGD